MGLPLVFVVDLVGQRGSDPPPIDELSLQHAGDESSGEQRITHLQANLAIEIWIVRRDQIDTRPRKPDQDR